MGRGDWRRCRRSGGHLPCCLILAWACLLCGSPTWCLPSWGLVQEDLNTRATWKRQRGSQAKDLGRCLLWSMSMDQSGLCLPLLAAVASLISPSTLAEEQSPFQNMAQLLWLVFPWRHTPLVPHQVLCWICRGHGAAASSTTAAFSQWPCPKQQLLFLLSQISCSTLGY